MKRILPTLTALFVFAATANAQVLNSKTKADSTIEVKRTIKDNADTAIERKLIELAMAGPAYRSSNHQLKINEQELKKAKNAWLNLLSLSYSVNDQTFNKSPDPTGSNTFVYPRYNFGVTIPLGIIFSQGSQIKTAREVVAYTKDQQAVLADNIKAAVLSKYREYREYNTLIVIQSELVNDVMANATQAEENFKNGNITVDIYLSVLKTKNEELAKSFNLKLQQELLKIEVERMIGVPLESVLHPAPESK
jgi:outer membrane protein TolC